MTASADTLGVKVVLSIICAWGVCAWALVGCRGDGGGVEPSYQAALAKAQANAETEQGRAYREALASDLANLLAAADGAARGCVARAERQVDVVLQVDAEGRVEEVRPAARTQGNRCFAAAVRGARVAAPPEPEYWVRVNLRGREAAPELDAARRAAADGRS